MGVPLDAAFTPGIWDKPQGAVDIAILDRRPVTHRCWLCHVTRFVRLRPPLKRRDERRFSTLMASVKPLRPLLVALQGFGRALRHVLRFCCLFVVHGDATDIPPAEVTALHDAFQDEMKILVPVRHAPIILSSSYSLIHSSSASP